MEQVGNRADFLTKFLYQNSAVVHRLGNFRQAFKVGAHGNQDSFPALPASAPRCRATRGRCAVSPHPAVAGNGPIVRADLSLLRSNSAVRSLTVSSTSRRAAHSPCSLRRRASPIAIRMPEADTNARIPMACTLSTMPSECTGTRNQ